MTTIIPRFKSAKEVINDIIENEASAIEQKVAKNSIYKTAILNSDVIAVLKSRGYSVNLKKERILSYYVVTA